MTVDSYLVRCHVVIWLSTKIERQKNGELVCVPYVMIESPTQFSCLYQNTIIELNEKTIANRVVTCACHRNEIFWINKSE